MTFYTKKQTSLLFALLFLATNIKAQTTTKARAANWLTLQKLLFKQSSASWSLTASELKQLKANSTASVFTPCAKVNTLTCVSSTLPVAGLVLQGRRSTSDKVTLKWETSAEYNSKGFVLERQSFNNTNVYDSIHYVAGAGTSYSKSDYQYLDFNNHRGSSFYRVKQIDRDGNYTYSNIAEIDGIQGEFAVNIIPNPARSMNVRLYFTVPDPIQTIDFTISNALGIPLIKKENFAASSGYYEIKNNAFKPGYYFITVQTSKGVYTKSFIIGSN